MTQPQPTAAKPTERPVIKADDPLSMRVYVKDAKGNNRGAFTIAMGTAAKAKAESAALPFGRAPVTMYANGEGLRLVVDGQPIQADPTAAEVLLWAIASKREELAYALSLALRGAGKDGSIRLA